MVARGFIDNGDFAAQALREITYRRWRDYDSADSVRYCTLRLHDPAFIKSDPTKLLAQGTDRRFFDALRREIKT